MFLSYSHIYLSSFHLFCPYANSNLKKQQFNPGSCSTAVQPRLTLHLEQSSCLSLGSAGMAGRFHHSYLKVLKAKRHWIVACFLFSNYLRPQENRINKLKAQEEQQGRGRMACLGCCSWGRRDRVHEKRQLTHSTLKVRGENRPCPGCMTATLSHQQSTGNDLRNTTHVYDSCLWVTPALHFRLYMLGGWYVRNKPAFAAHLHTLMPTSPASWLCVNRRLTLMPALHLQLSPQTWFIT